MTVDETGALCYTGTPKSAEKTRRSRERTRAISTGDFRINERIRAREVRLIDDRNENHGVVPIQKALQLASDRELDLVEVAPTANPPVCKIMDFGKFQYERAKKEREARKQQKQVEVKEIRLRPKTDDHHRSFKVRDARRWLTEGMKVKVRIRFRGREITYPEIARDMLSEVAEELKDIAIVEQAPNMEGRTMLMVLAPAPEKK
ncbi:MAG: translation initiation factor IF-3 [Chloroflexi bacterium]|nr:translation initiation factor IF-3 [Chloroflexota bacterium]